MKVFHDKISVVHLLYVFVIFRGHYQSLDHKKGLFLHLHELYCHKKVIHLQRRLHNSSWGVIQASVPPYTLSIHLHNAIRRAYNLLCTHTRDHIELAEKNVGRHASIYVTIYVNSIMLQNSYSTMNGNFR